MIESQQKISQNNNPTQRTIRADLINNHQFALMLVKLLFFFFVTCYIFQIFPRAIEITTYTPEKWQQTDILQLHQISPLNRFLKIYTAPVNLDQEMDTVSKVQVYSLRDNEEKDKKLQVQVTDSGDMVDISDNTLRFYYGDIHVLDQVSYRVKVIKPPKTKRVLQQEQIQPSKSKNQTKPTPNKVQNTQSQPQKKQKTQQQIKAQQQQKKKQQQQKKKEQEQKKRQQEQNKKQRQQKRKQEQQKKRKQFQQKIRKKQAQLKQKEQKQRKYDHTNIRIQVHQMSSFATIVQLIVRYISILVIIYVATDNADAPRSIAIICFITANPLLFLQISYPNIISDIIDCLCRSGPMLYFTLWLYYIHTSMDISITQQQKYKYYLIAKISISIILYLLNTLHLLHYNIFTLQILVVIVLCLLIGRHLWQIFLNLQQQHHRDKILMVVSFVYLGSLFTFKIITGSWKDLMFYIVHQMYGLYVIYLMATPKPIKGKKQKKEQRQLPYTLSQLQKQPIQSQLKQHN